MTGNRFLSTLSLIGLVVTLMVSSPAVAQEDWELVYSESDEFIRDLCFVPGDDSLWQNGWGITGYPESNIIKTTDGGDTWIEIEQDFSPLLASIWFTDENTGYICTLKSGTEAPRGLIMKSTDGGENWVEIRGGTEDTFDKIRFKDSQNGIVTGYPSLYTTDAGATWEELDAPVVYWQIDYASDDTYYGVHLGGDVGKSTDNGQTFSNVYSTDVLLGGVDFVDENHGLIGGDLSQVEVTHDGGETWETTTLGDGQRYAQAVGVFDADIMYAGCDPELLFKTTDGGETWEEDAEIENTSFRTMFVTSTNIVFAAGNGAGGISAIWRKVFEMPLHAIFEASETEVCDGSAVDFTDFSYYNVVEWNWTFEGGTPSTSTEQNPTVTYSNGGVYDVTLTVTNEDGDTQTLTETDLIEVSETPVQPEIPSGDADLCTSGFYTYTVPALDYAHTYDWELTPADAGELSWEENEAYLEVSDTWTGDFTIRVMAGNFCGDSPWSDYFNGTVYLTPDAFVLQGGGGYCEGGEGVEITIDGSQEGVNYELYLDGNPTGQIEAGTGDAISFGNQTEAGIYEAYGFNDNCNVYMSEQVEVMIYDLPTPEIEGLDMVCDNDVTEYETMDNTGSTYTWEVTGGTITDGQGTYMVTIEWGDAGDGTVTVTEMNENGCEATTEAFEVFIDDCTDIGETGINEFNIYPNPATSQLNIEFTNSATSTTQILIYNQLGQLEIDREVSGNSTKLDVSNLQNGLYILILKTDDKTIVTKRIIKK